jgi:hypothetical protein
LFHMSIEGVYRRHAGGDYRMRPVATAASSDT